MTKQSAPDEIGAWCTPARFAVLLGLLLVAQFPGVVFGTSSFFHRDFGVLAWPTVWYHRDQFWRGELPLWNPLSHCGVPFLAQWGTMVLYPGSLLYLLLPVPWSLNIFCLAHLWLGGVGMRRLAEQQTGDRFGAAVAGATFVFNGITMSCLSWPNYTAALGWMPWVIAFAEQATKRGMSASVLAVIFTTMQILSGAPEIILLTWLIIAAVALHGVLHDRRSWLATLRIGLVLGLAVGASAVQLLPFFDLLQHSQRLAEPVGERWALPLQGLINIVAPLIGRVRDMQGFLVQPGQEFFASVYLGCSTIAMVTAACSGRSQPMAWFLLALVFLGMWLAIGEQGGAWHWIQAVLPPLAFVRYPVKALILTMAASSLLTAFALKEIATKGEGIRERSLRRLLIWCCTVGIAITGATFAAQNWSTPGLAEDRSAWTNLIVRLVCLGGFITGVDLATGAQRRMLRLTASAGIIILLWIDFSTHMPGLNPVLPSRLLAPGYARPNGAPHFGSGRVFISPEAEAALLESHVRSPEADYVGKRLALWSNLNLLEDVPKVNGAATLRVCEQNDVEALLYGPGRINAEKADKLLGFLGVTHQTSQTNVTEWAERTNALPFITAGQEPVFVDGDAALAMLRSGNVDLAQQVLLPEAARAEAVGTRAMNLSRPATKITSRKLSANQIEFEVESAAPVWVVIAQTYDHNWRAWVNEERVTLWRADHAFQSIAVPRGVSRVVLRYEPASLRIGLAISSGTFILILAMTVRGVLLRRGDRPNKG